MNCFADRRGGASDTIGGSAIWRIRQEDHAMTYRVYSGPPGTEGVPPMEKERWLYKEFGLLDEALGWARHVNDGGRVTLSDRRRRRHPAHQDRKYPAALNHPEEIDRARTAGAIRPLRVPINAGISDQAALESCASRTCHR